MPSPRQHRGTESERLAEDLLVRRGYVVVERNWRGGGGEVDRIAWKDGLLCFVEVRSRTCDTSGSPEETVGWAKRRRLVRAARAYLARFPASALPMARFDVVGVLARPGEAPRLHLVENAFDEAGRPP